MSPTPKFKVVDEFGVTQHIGTRSECERYKANARSLFGGLYRVVPLGWDNPTSSDYIEYPGM